ncbi:MAG: hypothetical protein HY509_04675 [Acidobacteria bacterium]|nr:hypothetical protein [Acidobacteriota bacterium]
MGAEHYIVKGNGWEVAVAPLGTCKVLQVKEGLPDPADAVSWLNPGRFRVNCLGCGEPVIVRLGVAPVCEGCRE